MLSGADPWSELVRASEDSTGAEADGPSQAPSLSSDGQLVAFQSFATNLVTGDTNGAIDIFVHDRSTGATERVSVDSIGTEANGLSNTPAISGDGRYVTFSSVATNLVTGDTNTVRDIFLHDRNTSATTRISMASDGVTQANGDSWSPSISADGRYIAFSSDANNLVTGDGNFSRDVFVFDTQTTTTTRVSVDSSEVEGNGASDGAAISGDGQYVAFHSDATDLVAGDTNGVRDVFLRDVSAGTTTRISVDSSGVPGDGISEDPAINSDGRYIAFMSDATNLVTGDANSKRDVFVRAILPGVTMRVSVSSAGAEADAESGYRPAISADGQYVVFQSNASNLVTDDTNGVGDVFIRDRTSSETFRASVDQDGYQADGESTSLAISSDSACVAFQSAVTHTRIVPSAEPEQSFEPSGEMARAFTADR